MRRAGVISADNLPKLADILGRPISTARDLVDLALSQARQTLYVHPSANPLLNLPERLPRLPVGGSVPHPFVPADGGTGERFLPPGLAPWLVAYTAGARIDLAFTAYDHDSGLADAAPRDLIAGVNLFRALVRLDWRRTPGATFAALVRSVHRTGTPLDASAEPPEPARVPGIELDLRWYRPLQLHELGRRYVHAIDANGLYLSALSSLPLGFGEPEQVDWPSGVPPLLPGYWRVRLLPPEDLRYPDPLGGGERWITTPTIELAAQLGRIEHVASAILYPRASRFLEPVYRRLRDARTAALAPDGPVGADVARGLVKACYTLGIGALAGHWRHAGDELYRPDWRHAVVAQARANLYRRLRRLRPDHAPCAVDVDCIYVASDAPEAVDAVPEIPLGTGLGQWKAAGRCTVEEAVGALRAPDPIASLREAAGA